MKYNRSNPAAQLSAHGFRWTGNYGGVWMPILPVALVIYSVSLATPLLAQPAFADDTHKHDMKKMVGQ